MANRLAPRHDDLWWSGSATPQKAFDEATLDLAVEGIHIDPDDVPPLTAYRDGKMTYVSSDCAEDIDLFIPFVRGYFRFNPFFADRESQRLGTGFRRFVPGFELFSSLDVFYASRRRVHRHDLRTICSSSFRCLVAFGNR